jgi:Mrp family chromosome partitioning ATPase
MNIPYQNIEIEQAYVQAFSDPFRAIAICSANSGEGTTSLALALAKRNLMAGYSTLLVDLNLYHPSLKTLFESEMGNQIKQPCEITHSSSNKQLVVINTLLPEPQLVVVTDEASILTGIVAPTAQGHVLKLKQAGVLEQCIKQWREEFDTVIIDTSPLNRLNANNIPAERVASACDGTILTVLAGETDSDMLSTALEKLNNHQANLIGCIFNDRDNPRLKDELIRQANRIEKRWHWLGQYIKQKVSNFKLLSLDA